MGDTPEKTVKLQTQIDCLAKFIMAEIQGEPSQSQGAVDTAIRIIREQQAQLAEARELLERVSKADGPIYGDRLADLDSDTDLRFDARDWLDGDAGKAMLERVRAAEVSVAKRGEHLEARMADLDRLLKERNEARATHNSLQYRFDALVVTKMRTLRDVEIESLTARADAAKCRALFEEMAEVCEQNGYGGLAEEARRELEGKDDA